MRQADGFRKAVTRIIASSRALRPIPGKETAEIPGSLEWQRERDGSRNGIHQAGGSTPPNRSDRN